MTGEKRVRLDVEAEAVGGALGPQPRLLLGWRSVVGRVDLRQGELLGVEAQPLRSAHRAAWVPARLFEERTVGPRAAAREHDMTVEADAGTKLRMIGGLLSAHRLADPHPAGLTA